MGCGNSNSVEEKDNNQNKLISEQNQIQKKEEILNEPQEYQNNQINQNNQYSSEINRVKIYNNSQNNKIKNPPNQIIVEHKNVNIYQERNNFQKQNFIVTNQQQNF